MNKRTYLVIGVSSKQNRYANIAVRKLAASGHEVIAVGKSGGMLDGIVIHKEVPADTHPHTVLMYLSKKHQGAYNDLLTEMKPQRVIFNPGAENGELAARLEANGVDVLESCALVMHTLKKL